MFDLSMEVKAQVRRSILLQEAEDRRLFKRARGDLPRLQDRLLLGLGDVLIFFGRRLKAKSRQGPLAPALRAG